MRPSPHTRRDLNVHEKQARALAIQAELARLQADAARKKAELIRLLEELKTLNF